SEFELRCEGDDYNAAAGLLLEFDFDYLFLWGHYRLMSELHERLQGKISDRQLVQNSVGNLGSAYLRMGQVHKSIGLYQSALNLARQNHDRDGEGAWLGNLAVCFRSRGEHTEAMTHMQQSLDIRREVGNRKGEAVQLGNMGLLCSDVGQDDRAIE